MTDPKPDSIPYFTEDGTQPMPDPAPAPPSDVIVPEPPLEAPPDPITQPSEPTPPAPAPSAEDAPPQDSSAGAHAVDFVPDQAKLKASRGNPLMWAEEIARMLSVVSGVEYDASTLEPWLISYQRQLLGLSARSIAFEIANLPIDADAVGDIAFELLDFRDEMSRMVRRRAS